MANSIKRSVCKIGEYVFVDSNNKTVTAEMNSKPYPVLKHYDIYVRGRCIGVCDSQAQAIHVENMDLESFEQCHDIKYTLKSSIDAPTNEAIDAFIKLWIQENHLNTLHENNCQTFGTYSPFGGERNQPKLNFLMNLCTF